MKPWVTWIIPCVQFVLLCIQLWSMRRSIKIDKLRMERIPFWLTENYRLWHMNRLMFEWVKVNNPESYEDFVSVCLSKDDLKLLQIVGEGVSNEGNADDNGCR